MSESFQSNFKLKTLLVIFLTPILLLGFLVGPAQAGWADHLVISAVEITEGEGKTDHDFVEIYNPTANDINLKGYRLVKRTKTGTSDTSIKSWTDDAVIKAHSWRLWASSDDGAYSLAVGADDATKQTIAPDNGIAIRLGASDTGEIIDSVAWGAAENIFKEGIAAPALGAGEVLVRSSGVLGAGNGEDTNNNAGDFNIVLNYIPHNSQSAAMPAIESSGVADPIIPSIPDLSPSPDSAANTVIRRNLPVAEAGIDKEAVIGENIDFDGSDSFDPRGKELFFNWDFGDKSSDKGINVSHSYNTIGEYIVILKADNGESIGEDSLKVKVVAPEFSDKIILSEILPNPIGVDKDGEWIELYNSADVKFNLKGWILRTEAKTGGKQYIFPNDKFIEAESYLMVKRSESGLVLTNESGNISLIWPSDKIVSAIAYSAAKEGQSYAFINNAWQWTDVPTPGKENLVKALPLINSKEKRKIVPAVSISKNTENEEIAGSEKEIAAEGLAVNPLLVKSTVLQIGKNFNAEDFLDKLIAEKVEKAVLKARASELSSQEKELILNNNIPENGNNSSDKEAICRDFCEENSKINKNDQKDVRNNPWFYGDLALSALSLFLVWRYQEVRKKLKN